MPPQEQLKAVGDSVAIPTAILAWFKAITIDDWAVFAALVYTVCRIIEWSVSWLMPRICNWFEKRRKRKKGD